MSAAVSQPALRKQDRKPLLALHRTCALWAAWDCFDYAGALQVARQDPELQSAHARTLRILHRIVSLLENGALWPTRGFTGLELVTDLQQCRTLRRAGTL